MLSLVLVGYPFRETSNQGGHKVVGSGLFAHSNTLWAVIESVAWIGREAAAA